MKKRIFISTGWDSLNFLRSDRENKNLKLIETNKFIGYDHTTNEFVANKSDTDIILIKDTATKVELTSVGLIFNPKQDCFLHHTNTNALKDVQGTLFAQITFGLHDREEKYKYKPVFDIILDQNNDKLNRILEKIDFTEEKIEEKTILETKLNFLHHLLVPSNVASQKIDSTWNADTEFEAFKQIAKKEDAFSENYVNSLSILRDKLLSS